MKNRKDPLTRRPTKHPTTFKMQLNEEQKEAKAIALENVVTIFTGEPGTSKTFLNCNIALDLLISNKVGKIIVTRPTVQLGEGMGFLPGDAFDFKEGKMAPYLNPILQSMYDLKGKEAIDAMIKKEEIEISPLAFVRGRNFKDCVVIVDEAQNLTVDELKALTTRICDDAYMLFTCDVNQTDLRDKNKSAGRFLMQINKLPGVAMVELTKNYRSPLAISIMKLVDKLEDESNKTTSSL